MAPVLIHRKEYRTDSGGAGTFRGGLGQVMEIESAEDTPFAIATAFDRIDHPARGVEGGAPGMAGASARRKAVRCRAKAITASTLESI